jgi:hypothetical protein
MDDQSLAVGGLNPAKTLFPAGALTETMLAGVLGPVLDPDEAKNLGAASTATLDIPSFGVLIKALQTNNDVDVLSNPHLLIMNNEDGEISVGSRIPFPVSRSAWAAGGSAGPRRSGFGGEQLSPAGAVALELKITPHVNEHDMVRRRSREDLRAAPGPEQPRSSTSERTAKTIVVAMISNHPHRRADVTAMINSVTKVRCQRHPDPRLLLPQPTKKVVKTNPSSRSRLYVISDMRICAALEKDEGAARVHRALRRQDRFGLDANTRRKKVGMLEEINRVARRSSPRRRAAELRER